MPTKNLISDSLLFESQRKKKTNGTENDWNEQRFDAESDIRTFHVACNMSPSHRKGQTMEMGCDDKHVFFPLSLLLYKKPTLPFKESKRGECHSVFPSDHVCVSYYVDVRTFAISLARSFTRACQKKAKTNRNKRENTAQWARTYR